METLGGWKEIARYLGRGVRTVQRWEELGLPIHRPAGHPRSAVLAIPGELDAWMAATPLHLADVIADLKEQVQRLQKEVERLKAESAGQRRKAKGAD